MSQSPDLRSELPPSAKLVLKVLEVDGRMTQNRLAEETRLQQRTVRNAVSRLEDAGVVQSEVYFRDARKKRYSVTGPVASDESDSLDR